MDEFIHADRLADGTGLEGHVPSIDDLQTLERGGREEVLARAPAWIREKGEAGGRQQPSQCSRNNHPVRALIKHVGRDDSLELETRGYLSKTFTKRERPGASGPVYRLRPGLFR